MTLKSHLFIIAFITSSILSSCYKREIQVNISGTVYDEVTNKPIKGEKVFLLGSDGGYSSVTYLLNYSISNEDGKYSFNIEIPRNKYDGFRVLSLYNGIKGKPKDYERTSGNTDINLILDLFHTSRKILKLQVKNSNTTNHGIRLLDYDFPEYILSQKGGRIYIQDQYGQTAYGTNVDTTFYVPIPGDGSFKGIEFQLQKSDGTWGGGFSKPINLNPYNGDTLQGILEY